MPRFKADFRNFVGGLNTVTTNDTLSDIEFPELNNINLEDRGSFKRRHGMVKELTPINEGKGQGFFRFFRKNRNPIMMYAIDGKLYQQGKDEIELNDLVEYAYVEAGTGYKIVSVELPNYKENLSLTDLDFTIVETIDSANQIAVEETTIKISLDDTVTLWEEEPTLREIQEHFYFNPITLYYDIEQELTIEGLEKGFQRTRRIEAVQYREKVYIATGTRLVEFDGAVAKVVEAHKPDSLEALYVGTNALADDPDNYMQDSVGTELRIDGVTADKTKGVLNRKTTFTAYFAKPPTIETLEFQFSYKEPGKEEFTVAQDWSEEKVWEFEPEFIGHYELDIKARDKANVDDEARFIVPKYEVFEDDRNTEVEFISIHRCNRIILHWERLILYHDDTNSGLIFISHLKKPDYFPMPNTLQFENKEAEPLTALIQYRDMLVAFTTTSIQALYGTNPSDFRRVTLNTGIGCIAPFTARVTANYITFLSHDGIYALTSTGITQDHANVDKVDKNVDNIVPRTENAYAISHDSQYHIVFPDEKKRLRCYYEENGIWTKDESDKLDLVDLNEYNGDLYVQRFSNGEILRFDKNTWNDDGYVYEDRVETKEFDFGAPYDEKKMKQLRLFMKAQAELVGLSIFLYADGALIIDPTVRYAKTENGETFWVEEDEPNLVINSGTVLGAWIMGEDSFGSIDSKTFKRRVSGRFRRIKLSFSHVQSTPNQILGFGFIYTLTRE